MHHSVRGAQYAAAEYHEGLQAAGISLDVPQCRLLRSKAKTVRRESFFHKATWSITGTRGNPNATYSPSSAATIETRLHSAIDYISPSSGNENPCLRVRQQITFV
jgi:hypothetical protein